MINHKTGYYVMLGTKLYWHRLMTRANERYHASSLPREKKAIRGVSDSCECWQCRMLLARLAKLAKVVN